MEKSNQSRRPKWIIDVERLCIRECQPDCDYIALSYVWGSESRHSDSLRLCENNVGDLKEPSSLASDTYSPHIPMTIEHAIRFIPSIGVRYLWVDRLCIIQDSPTKAEEINNMGYIYRDAYLTIVAAAGKDADYGLPGLEGISYAKSKELYYIPRTSTRNDIGDDPWRKEQNHHALLQDATWNQRGWTLSELVSSQRVLCFHDHTVTWECHCAVWHEESTLDYFGDQCLSRTSRPGYGFHQMLWPDLQAYTRLVQEYTMRKFSRVEDVTSAFAGITTTLS